MDMCRGGLAVGYSYIFSAITHQDVAAFQSCVDSRLSTWERRAIFEMDRVRLSHLNKRDDKASTESALAASDAPELTTELFDAMFG